MKLKYLIDEDFINYKKTSMVLGFPNCSMKCNIDFGGEICQNSTLSGLDLIDISAEDLCSRYLKNNITHAVVCQGLEPFDSPFDLITFVDTFRNKFKCDDDIVVYTGYTEEECNGIASKEYEGINFSKIHAVYNQLSSYNNIIVKFGRYIPGKESRLDEVLGVRLASNNQYAKVLPHV